MSKYIKLNKKNYDYLYLKSTKKAKQTPKYIHNEMQINCIKEILIEHAFVPEELIDLLIESVEENVELKYEFVINSYNKINQSKKTATKLS